MKKFMHTNRGFTIMELMIATTVLSVVLLLTTSIMINIGGLYEKGVRASTIQDDARSIIDDLSQNIELNNSLTRATSGSVTSYCIGNVRYTFVIGQQIGNGTQHALWRDTAPTTCSPLGVNLNSTPASSGGSELVTPRSRLAALSICDATANCVSPAVPPFTISATVIYGDAYLLCDAGFAGDCALTTDSSRIWNPTVPNGPVRCKGHSDQQYCATASLTTTVVPRIHQ